jgi:hypothetical protein
VNYSEPSGAIGGLSAGQQTHPSQQSLGEIELRLSLVGIILIGGQSVDERRDASLSQLGDSVSDSVGQLPPTLVKRRLKRRAFEPVVGGFSSDPDAFGGLRYRQAGFGFAIAESFTPTSNFLFTSVELPMGIISGPNSFTVSLMSDTGGHPGTALESFALTGVPFYTNPAIEQFTSSIHTQLNEGTTYWIAAIPNERDTAGGWFINSTGATGVSKTGNDGVTWSAFADTASAAFEVDGTLLTPEPSTLTVATVVGLCSLVCCAIRKRLNRSGEWISSERERRPQPSRRR